MSRLLFASTFALALLSIPVVAAAQPGQPPPPPPPGSSPGYGYGAYGMTVPGVNEHEGFFLRLGIGFGYLNASTEVLDETLAIKGPSGIFQLALGANLSQNLIIYGELFGSAVVDPTVSYGDEEETVEDASGSLSAVGVGLAYYLPSNFYFSGTLAASVLSWTQDTGEAEIEADTEIGGALIAQIGKEWWVSDNWGIGLAGQFLVSSNKDDEEAVGEDEVTWTTIGFGLLFSATYD